MHASPFAEGTKVLDVVEELPEQEFHRGFPYRTQILSLSPADLCMGVPSQATYQALENLHLYIPCIALEKKMWSGKDWVIYSPIYSGRNSPGSGGSKSSILSHPYVTSSEICSSFSWKS